MTIDERIEFLMQSIESHDRQMAELVENGARVDARLDTLTTRLDNFTANVDRFREMTQLNFDRLTQAMMGLTEHIVDHQRRITDIEGGRS
jgi:hypothetical protein